MGIADFDDNLHAKFVLNALKPRESNGAHTFETTRSGAGLPDAGTEYGDAQTGESRCCGHHLFFGFGATRAGNEYRGFIHDGNSEFLGILNVQVDWSGGG